jgi:molecular chaperone GrpE
MTDSHKDTDRQKNVTETEEKNITEAEENENSDALEAEAEPMVEAEAAEVRDPQEELQQELEKLKEDYLRLAAEFDNYKKRSARNFEAMARSAVEPLIISLLEVLDNFDRALVSAEEKPDFESYQKGMKLIYDQLLSTLSRQGITRFESLGEKFDPNLHDAMLTVESDKYEPDHIAQELSPGYKLNDKVIRHAKVGVVGSKQNKDDEESG